jgi:protein-S-isoprenylcysteine O-methyltransferase Ste14
VSGIEITARLLVGACWFAWLYPFLFRAPHNQKRKSVTRKGATLAGLLLETTAISLAMFTGFLPHDPTEWWRVALVAVFSAPSIALAFSAVKHLGRQFRVNAGLYDDHELVRTGAYSVVRHPIYAGLFGMTLATLAISTPWPWAAASIAMFLAGTEIRVYTEEALLRGRFGADFDDYQRSVKAYIPFIR